MKKLMLILFFAATVKAQVFQKPDDKAYHVYAGAAIAPLTGAIAYKKTHKMGLSILIGFTASVAAGGAKELLYDGLMNKGFVSKQDFWHTVWGGVIGSFGLAAGIHMHKQNKIDKEQYENL